MCVCAYVCVIHKDVHIKQFSWETAVQTSHGGNLFNTTLKEGENGVSLAAGGSVKSENQP